MKREFLTKSLAAATLAGVLVLGGSACGKAADKVSDKIAEKSLEKATGGSVDIDTNDDEVRIKTDDGEYSSKASKKLPDAWPTDFFPVPGGFTIENVTEMTINGAKNMTAISTGKGDVDALIDDFVAGFEKEGLEITLQSKAGDTGMVIATKGAASYQVTVNADGDELSLSMTVATDPTAED